MTQGTNIAFLGGGNMAAALIQGLIKAKTRTCAQIMATDVRPDALENLAKTHGIATRTDNLEAVRWAQLVVLSVKPQVFPQLLPQIAEAIGPEHTVLSIAAGVPLAVIEAGLGESARVVRAMPNTPALVGAGATALAAGRHAGEAELQAAESVFRSVGITVRVPESLLDAVTGLSGSGPAYVFRMVEGLTQAGAAVGLPQEAAALLAAQTVYGAAKLLHESSETPEALRRKVSSPGGTTVAGLDALREQGFTDTLRHAVQRATERGKELGDEARRKFEGE